MTFLRLCELRSPNDPLVNERDWIALQIEYLQRQLHDVEVRIERSNQHDLFGGFEVE